jgi:GH15 family glucan-1,4-alpha-glucosidase
MSSLDLAVIGNCEIAALVDRDARIVWCCLPRFDGDPAFHALLAGEAEPREGVFAIDLAGVSARRRRYVRNTAVLETELESPDGAIRVVDHVPRHVRFGRTYRPAAMLRRVEPLRGRPRVTVRVAPRADFGRRIPEWTRGSNHIRYLLDGSVLRLTTTAPVDFVLGERTFVLDRPYVFLLGPDETPTESLDRIEQSSREATIEYWRDWTRRLAVPLEWQDVVIRSAITLKLCSYEASGAIVAALTTSIPEYGTPGRTWDYRFCWLRDAFFVVQALNRLGATTIMENFISYATNVVARSVDGYLQPLYGLTFESGLEERVVEGLAGYRGLGPVRVGNRAYAQTQNDSYGSVVLAIAQSFYDTRLSKLGDVSLLELLEPLGGQAVARWNEPDAGVWEFRERAAVHTHSAVMCWAACDRLARIAGHLGVAERQARWAAAAAAIRDGILERAWNPRLGCLTSEFGGRDVDAALLLLPDLGFLAWDDERFRATLGEIERRLRVGNHLYRYASADDFGVPESAFTICTLWYAETLARLGREEEAREVFADVLAARTDLGFLSEGIDTSSGMLWGNFPQSYSMVGLIRVARRLSKPWEDAF